MRQKIWSLGTHNKIWQEDDLEYGQRDHLDTEKLLCYISLDPGNKYEIKGNLFQKYMYTHAYT